MIPSPYSPPRPIPALTTEGKTKIPAALLASSRAPPICRSKLWSVLETLASISMRVAASLPLVVTTTITRTVINTSSVRDVHVGPGTDLDGRGDLDGVRSRQNRGRNRVMKLGMG